MMETMWIKMANMLDGAINLTNGFVCIIQEYNLKILWPKNYI